MLIFKYTLITIKFRWFILGFCVIKNLFFKNKIVKCLKLNISLLYFYLRKRNFSRTKIFNKTKCFWICYLVFKDLRQLYPMFFYQFYCMFKLFKAVQFFKRKKAHIFQTVHSTTKQTFLSLEKNLYIFLIIWFLSSKILETIYVDCKNSLELLFLRRLRSL